MPADLLEKFPIALLEEKVSETIGGGPNGTLGGIPNGTIWTDAIPGEISKKKKLLQAIPKKL